MSIPIGERDRPVTFQRATVTADSRGGEELVWADLEKAMARIRFGTAQEKREAAQEAGSQTASFEVLPSAALLAVTLKDHILYDGSEWDIVEKALLDRQRLRFTAVRSI